MLLPSPPKTKDGGVFGVRTRGEVAATTHVLEAFEQGACVVTASEFGAEPQTLPPCYKTWTQEAAVERTRVRGESEGPPLTTHLPTDMGSLRTHIATTDGPKRHAMSMTVESLWVVRKPLAICSGQTKKQSCPINCKVPLLMVPLLGPCLARYSSS